MAEGFSSDLSAKGERYLSLLLQYSLAENWLTPQDVLSEFPPSALMAALEGEGAEGLRSRLLVEAAGVHAKIAPKKSTAAASEDLQLALDEKVCTPERVLEIFTADEQVRHLKHTALFALLTRDAFYSSPSDRARARMLFTLQTAIDQGLLSQSELVLAVTPARLAQDLPRELLEQIAIEALRAGLDGASFEATKLLSTVPLARWVEHVALTHLWSAVILGPVNKASGLGIPAPEGASETASAAEGDAAERAAPGVSVAPVSDRSREEIVARDRALLNLRNLDREPKNSEKLPTPLLLAIDSMYAELLALPDDESREDCIREAFPNEKLLVEALLVLAETLDPRIEEQELRAKEPEVDALIQLVLHEERHRASGLSGRGSSPPPAVVPGQASEAGPSIGLPPLPPSRRSAPPVPMPPPPSSKAN